MTDPKPIGDSPTLTRLQERLAEIAPEPFTGTIPQGETPEEKADRKRLQHQGAVSRWERRRPVMYSAADVSHLDPEQGPQALADWVRNPDARNLILAGPVGTGKTYAAYALGNLLIQANKSVDAWTVPDFLAALRPDGENQADAKAAAQVAVLILDDLGAGQPTEWAVETLTTLLDTRLRNDLRTIVTTNLTEAQIQEAWGGRFIDRLRYASASVVVRGQSRRTPLW